MSVSVAVGIGTGIAFGLDTSIRGHFDEGADSDPDTDADPGISRMSTILSEEPAKPWGRDVDKKGVNVYRWSVAVRLGSLDLRPRRPFTALREILCRRGF